jgi:hypothetical protein
VSTEEKRSKKRGREKRTRTSEEILSNNKEGWMASEKKK